MSTILRAKEINEFVNKLKLVYKELKDERLVLKKIEEETKNYLSNLTEQESENKKFTIGIVGQVKAGKSSFLNSLFFNGKDILPKAATPMTAALTKICYSDRVYAKVHFFSEEEWKMVKEGYETAKYAIEREKENKNKRLKEKGREPTSQSDNSILNMVESVSIPDKSFFEMYESYSNSKNKKDILERLKKEHEELACESIDDLKEKLGTYVGVGGIYTPIVKYVEVFVDIEDIKNFDIVDTPGLNDPVISRGQITRNFLGKCDVVFLLSSSGQFLDSNDIGLFSEQLEESGISNKVVVGTKFDSAIIGEAKNYGGVLDITVSSIKKKLDDRVVDILKTNERIGLLENHSSLYISSMCYNISIKNENELDEEEEHVKTNLSNTFPKGDFSKAGLKKLSSIERFKTDIMPDIEKKKEGILKVRLQALSDGVHKAIESKTLEEQKYLEEYAKQLETADIGKLKEDMKNSEKKIGKIKGEVNSFFNNEIHNIKLELQKVEEELEKMTRDKDVSVKTKQEQVSRSVEKDGFFAGLQRGVGSLFDKDWGYKTEYSTETTSYVQVLDTIKLVDNLVNDIKYELINRFQKIIDIEKITNGALTILKEKELIDTESDDFDSQIFRTLKTNLQNISLSKIELKKEYSKNLEQEFRGGENESNSGGFFSAFISASKSRSGNKTEDIDGIRTALYNTLKDISNDLSTEINKELTNITNELKKQSEDISTNLSKNIELSISKLESELKDKQKNIKIYKNAIELLGILNGALK